VFAGVVALAIFATSMLMWRVVSQVDGITKVDVFGGKSRPAKDDGAQNFLIVGSDDRTGIPRKVLTKLHAHGKPCQCTDTMMLVHVSKKRDKATIVSLPRDSFVAFPSFTDKNGVEHGPSKGKLNAAYGLGGPKLTVETIEDATGVRIDHYIEVNFVSFVQTVDALGGVDVCTPRRLRDPKSGLDLKAGTHTLDGAESLKYVRARYVDPTADFGRMDRQQKFISSIISKATSGETLRNPIKLNKFVSAALGSVKTDKDLGASDLFTLGTKLRNLSTSSVTFAQVPIADDDFRAPGWGSSVLWDEDKAKDLFTAIKDDEEVNAPPKPAADAATVKVPPGSVRVQVFNAAGVKGLGRKASDELRAAGFVIAGPARNAAESGDATTVIRYDPRYDESAKTVQASLAGSTLKPVKGQGRVLQVYVGSSYTGVTKVTVAATAATGTGATPAPEIKTHTAADNVCKKKAS
jgi:LCP family protein required for cell wall assembly